MFERRWTYSSRRPLTQWYGQVEYYGRYVIGQWFALDADSGAEFWSRTFRRPTTICGCAQDIIVASETRSDGPWTFDFGVYGIEAGTGVLRWNNHGGGLWGQILRCCDFAPLFTNEFRDAPLRVTDKYVTTRRGRMLDVQTGREVPSVPSDDRHAIDFSTPMDSLYRDGLLSLDGRTIQVQGHGDAFTVAVNDRDGQTRTRFAAGDHAMQVDGNFFSYRLQGNRIVMILSTTTG